MAHPNTVHETVNRQEETKMRDQQKARSKRSQAGFTLVEVAIIVMVLAILSAILLPQIGGFLRDARYARAREDVGAIGVAMMQLLKDIGESSFYTEPQGNWRSPYRIGENDGEPVGLLIGDGDTPDGEDQWDWREPFGGQVSSAGTDFGDVWVKEGVVDSFANHLIQNDPSNFDTSAGAGPDWRRYRTPADMIGGDYSAGVPGGLLFDGVGGQGFNSEFGWRGPYLDAVRPDPWGNRYMANVLWLTMPQGAASSGFMRTVVVVSAGPDEEIDIPFGLVGGFAGADDDIAYPVAYGSLR